MDKKAKELSELLQFYENNLCDRIFRYQLNNKIDIDVIFYREDFCHLIGIQHVFEKNKKYLGASGYEKVKNQKLKIKNLKAHNLAGFNKIELRLRGFSDLHTLMQAGEFLKFYRFRAFPPTEIEADFIVYLDDKKYILHLFLRKNQENSCQYSPVSYVVKSGNDKNSRQFINAQEYKKVTHFEVIPTKKD